MARTHATCTHAMHKRTHAHTHAYARAQVSNSHELHTFLGVVLKIGNFLNSNRQPVPVAGFR
jgi:hypothetical protein